MSKNTSKTLIVLLLATQLGGCLAVSATSAVVGTAVGVTGAVVGATVHTTGAVVDAVTPGDDDDDDDRRR